MFRFYKYQNSTKIKVPTQKLILKSEQGDHKRILKMTKKYLKQYVYYPQQLCHYLASKRGKALVPVTALFLIVGECQVCEVEVGRWEAENPHIIRGRGRHRGFLEGKAGKGIIWKCKYRKYQIKTEM